MMQECFVKYRLARLVIIRIKCILIHSDSKIRYMKQQNAILYITSVSNALLSPQHLGVFSSNFWDLGFFYFPKAQICLRFTHIQRIEM